MERIGNIYKRDEYRVHVVRTDKYDLPSFKYKIFKDGDLIEDGGGFTSCDRARKAAVNKIDFLQGKERIAENLHLLAEQFEEGRFETIDWTQEELSRSVRKTTITWREK